MGANQRIAGAHPNTGVIFTSRAAAELDAGRNTGINTGGLYSPHTEVVERRAAVAGDPGACLKMLKSMQPHGLEKSDEPVVVAKPEPAHKVAGTTEAITGPVSVTDMIKAAQSNPGAIEDLARGYSGREIAAIAKAAAAKPREVTNKVLDGVSLPLKKAVVVLDEMVRRAVERSLAKLA